MFKIAVDPMKSTWVIYLLNYYNDLDGYIQPVHYNLALISHHLDLLLVHVKNL